MSASAQLSLSVEYSAGDFSLRAALELDAEAVALVGPNGSGKTSLLLAILGVRMPERGRIVLGDSVLFDAERRIFCPTEERGLAYLPQDFGLFPFLSVEDNVAFAIACRREKRRRAERKRLARDYLDRLGVARLAARRPDQLSGGERQRVALARALASEPRAMLLDEPTAALDVGARDEVRELIRNNLRELAIPALIVTHDFNDVTSLASRVAVMDAGQLVSCVPTSEAQTRPPTAFVARLANSKAAQFPLDT
jgi:molybdate transport system ATP-binding protein